MIAFAQTTNSHKLTQNITKTYCLQIHGVKSEYTCYERMCSKVYNMRVYVSNKTRQNELNLDSQSPVAEGVEMSLHLEKNWTQFQTRIPIHMTTKTKSDKHKTRNCTKAKFYLSQ